MAEKIRVLIVDDLPDTREHVRTLLSFESDIEVVGQAGTGTQAVELARQHRPDLILMDINMPGGDGIAASQTISKSVPTAQIIIMSVQSEADYLRRAMLAGARDFLMKPFSGDELITAIRRVHDSRPVAASPSPTIQPGTAAPTGGRKTAAPPQEGQIILVFSPKGGSGCSTIAVNLAVALSQADHHTMLVDGSLQFGDVAVMLNLKPTTSVIDLVERSNDLEPDLISSIAQPYSPNLKVLQAPPRPEMAELVQESHVKRILKMMRQMYEFIVIDTSSSLSEVALAMMDEADRIVVIAQQNLPSLKNVSRFIDLTRELEYDQRKLMLVVNRATNKQSISVKDVGDTLKRPVVAIIPLEEAAANDAADQGRPLVTGQWQKRPIATALLKLTDVVKEELRAQPEAAGGQPAATSRLARLFGR
jgi:pilus assembly protein CpaE